MLQGREEVKNRWTEHCSGLVCTDSGHSDNVVTESDQVSPLPNAYEINDILYEKLEAVAKSFKDRQQPRH